MINDYQIYVLLAPACGEGGGQECPKKVEGGGEKVVLVLYFVKISFKYRLFMLLLFFRNQNYCLHSD